MFLKKKIKISKAIACVMYILEKEHISPKSFYKVIDILWDVAGDVGGTKMMNTTFKCLVELRKRGAE